MTRPSRSTGRAKPSHGAHRAVPSAAEARKAARRRTGIAVGWVVLLGGVFAVPAANASSTAEGTHPVRNCTLDARTGEGRCYATFTQAMAHATGGRITDAPATARAAAHSTAFRAATKQLAASGGAPAATLFTGRGFTGDSLTVTGSGRAVFRYDLSEGWRAKVSSVQPWAGRTLRLYAQPGLRGAATAPLQRSTRQLPRALDNRARSLAVG